MWSRFKSTQNSHSKEKLTYYSFNVGLFQGQLVEVGRLKMVIDERYRASRLTQLSSILNSWCPIHNIATSHLLYVWYQWITLKYLLNQSKCWIFRRSEKTSLYYLLDFNISMNSKQISGLLFWCISPMSTIAVVLDHVIVSISYKKITLDFVGNI